MNKQERSTLYALTIGDGCIRARQHRVYNYTQYSISFVHCLAQKDYIEYKANLVNTIFGGKQVCVKQIDNNGYGGFIYTKSHADLRYLYSHCYAAGKKTITKYWLNQLTPLGIAIWYMDDGNLAKKKRNGKVHAFDLYLNTFVTDAEHDIIIEYFQDVWNVKFTKVKNHNGYRLRCGTTEAKKFIAIIQPYVLDCFYYKIDMSVQNN